MKKASIGLPWPAIARRTLFRIAGFAAFTPITPSHAGAEIETNTVVPELWTSAFAGKKVWAYASKHSVAPGEAFAVMLSTGPNHETIKGRLEFFRIGHHPPIGQRLIWTSPEVTVVPRSVSRTAAAIGAAWPPSISDIPTAAWPPGYYSADFIHSDTSEREPQVVQIVIRNPSSDRRVLLKLSTNTYQAYNAWGGHSLYPSEDESKRGTIVAFDRPSAPAFFEYEAYLLRWLEELGAENGFEVHCATDFDAHRDPSLLSDYSLVISGSHDEYWTKEMFDAFEHRIFKLGRNVIFFGANAAYCQVRFADVDCPPDGESLGRQLVCHKNIDDPITQRASTIAPELLATTQFRQNARRPETMLLGVAYQSWFQPSENGPRFPYYVASTDAPFFAGLEYKVGDPVADVVGYEWDNRDPDGDGRRLWDSERSHNALLPADSLHVLFHGEPVNAYGKPGRAEAVYLRSPAGAKVFSAGSIRWAWGLGKPGFERAEFKRFNANLVLDFLK